MPMWVRKTSADRRYKEIKILPVQVLYNTCKEVFENFGPGIVPWAENMERLKAAMDGMTGADVGLRPGMQFFRRFPIITYIRIYECDKFSIGLFCLPQSAVIPLHNHTEMTVFSKLLFGTINVNSFDWVNADPPNNECGIFSAVPLRGTNSPRLGSDFKPAGAPRLAKTKAEYEVSAPCKTSVLYPADRGNLHTVRALTPCAFLEVVAPPCSVSRGWPCTYYRKYHFSTLSAVGMISVPEEQRPGYVWLQKTEKCDDSLVYEVEYTGPCIVTE